MRVFFLASGQDTGGQGFRMAQALNRHVPGFSARAMHSSDTYIQYPSDLKWDYEEARKLYSWADVVHHRNTVVFYEFLDILRRRSPLRRPTVLHHHGSHLRNSNMRAYYEGQSIGAVQIVSTIDLLDDAPTASWLPAPFDVEEIGRYRSERPAGRRIRLGHAPTNRQGKGTEVILAALDRLSEKHNIEVDLIEGAPWVECLQRKGRCDIFIDQLTLGYGNNAIEAWAMGIPVVSGFAEPSDRDRFLRVARAKEAPFMDASAHPSAGPLARIEAVMSAIERLIDDPALRIHYGERGLMYVQRWHAERKVAERLAALYRGVPPSSGEPPQLAQGSITRNAVARMIGIQVRTRGERALARG